MESLSMEQLSKVLETPASSYALFKKLSQYEMEASLLAASTQANPELLSGFYASYLVAHLLVDEIYEARMLTQRMPSALVTVDPTLQNALILLGAVWQKDHNQVYEIIRELPWPTSLRGLIRRYEFHFQIMTFRNLSRTYDIIRPATVTALMGLGTNSGVGMGDEAGETNPEVIESFVAKGWHWDPEARLLYPKIAAKPSKSTGPPRKVFSTVLGLIGNRRD